MLPRAVRLEVKATRGTGVHLEERDLKGITPHGHLAALVTARVHHGPRWVLVPGRLLSVGDVETCNLVDICELGALTDTLNRVWSDWLLDRNAWSQLLAAGIPGARERLEWCRREHPPRKNGKAGNLREQKLQQALLEFRTEVDKVAAGGTGAQAEGQIHQLLLEDALREGGYVVLPNAVGIPDIAARLPEMDADSPPRLRLHAWAPLTGPLKVLRDGLLALEDEELEQVTEILSPVQ